jgi:alpha-amylase
MRTICLYFQVHQPFRFRRYRFFDVGNEHYYYDDYTNESILRKVADNCYLPANKILLELIRKHEGKFRVAFSISGVALDQFELYAPEVLESFKELAKTGSVEFLAETNAHSLAALKDRPEFEKQVMEHIEKVKQYFGQSPSVFRNTELVYSDEIGAMIADMGFEAMLTEGAKHILGWKSPNYLYCNAINPKLKILLKNFTLSDDIAFRFSDKGWKEYPLTAEKFVGWLNKIDKKEETVNLFMDYETFGEHQWAETGIFGFLKSFPDKVFGMTGFSFSTPSEIAKSLQPVSAIQVPYPISWADEERDLTAWLGNEMQQDAFNKLYDLSEKVKKANDPVLAKDWNYLQLSDHFYYMCTKFFSDGAVHSYFNPYQSPYDAFINYMNILSDFAIRVNTAVPETDIEQEIAHLTSIIKEKDKLIEKYTAELERLSSDAAVSSAEKVNMTPAKSGKGTKTKISPRGEKVQKVSGQTTKTSKPPVSKSRKKTGKTGGSAAKTSDASGKEKIKKSGHTKAKK